MSRRRVEPDLVPRRLLGQKALVTGGSSGIGKATAVALGAAGADVVVNYSSNVEGATETVAEIVRAGSRAIAHKADVSNEQAVAEMFERMYAEFGTVDILVANAGLQRDAPFDEMTLEDWQVVLDVNLTGQFLCCREAVREFKRRGTEGSGDGTVGKIVCVSSVHEAIPWAGRANYAASKGGVMMLMKSIAQELAGQRIRINGICPGAIRTSINRDAWDSSEARERLLDLIPSKRIGEPEEIGRIVAWLASDDADYIHGTSLFVDGGMTLYPAFADGG